jgi:hypothetical protein|tara:strand:- start:23387 stop:24376 length:990 start_codon:yes stop_codon:yes gene_type:complete
MHAAAYDFVKRALDAVPPGPTLEVGSMDINGSVRALRPDAYVGIDIRPGASVDVQAEGARLPIRSGSMVAALSCGTLEHTMRMEAICGEMGRSLQLDGALVVTAAGPGWPPHSWDGGMPPPEGEYYRAVDKSMLAAALRCAGTTVLEAQETADGDLFVSARRDPVRLDLGSGPKACAREGYTAVDANPACGADVTAAVPPIPWADGVVETIYARHFLEHLTDDEVCRFMADAWRVLRRDGLLEVVVPYALCHAGIQDPTHRSLWVPEKFAYFTAHFSALRYSIEQRFQLVHVAGVAVEGQGVEIRATLQKLDAVLSDCICPFHGSGGNA